MNDFLFVVDYNIIVFYCRAHVTTVYTALYVEICLYMSAKLSGQSVIFACPPLRIDDAYVECCWLTCMGHFSCATQLYYTNAMIFTSPYNVTTGSVASWSVYLVWSLPVSLSPTSP